MNRHEIEVQQMTTARTLEIHAYDIRAIIHDDDSDELFQKHTHGCRAVIGQAPSNMPVVRYQSWVSFELDGLSECFEVCKDYQHVTWWFRTCQPHLRPDLSQLPLSDFNAVTYHVHTLNSDGSPVTVIDNIDLAQ